MAPLIADDTYRIWSVAFPNYVINLAGGLPFAAVTAWPGNSTSNNLRWIVSNLRQGPVTLESAAARNYYAAMYNYNNFSPLSGDPNPTYWRIEPVITAPPSPEAKYRIVSVDSGLAVTLTEGSNEVSIYLRPIGEVPPQQQEWRFERS